MMMTMMQTMMTVVVKTMMVAMEIIFNNNGDNTDENDDFGTNPLEEPFRATRFYSNTCEALAAVQDLEKVASTPVMDGQACLVGFGSRDYRV